jgi:hypothetical protein
MSFAKNLLSELRIRRNYKMLLKPHYIFWILVKTTIFGVFSS